MDTFADLPDALVRDLLATAEPVGRKVAENLRILREARAGLRKQASAQGAIKRKADLDVSREPSVVGIDGSYQIHRLTALDLAACAAVAVEGTAKEARRYWPEPYHEMWVDTLPHDAEVVGALRGLMVSMELRLASTAPHDLVLLDGSFSSLIIYLNQALTQLGESAASLKDAFLSNWNSGLLGSLKALVTSERTVAIPKFTSRNELQRDHIAEIGMPVDGKTVATLILDPGEYIEPLPVYSDADPSSRQVDHLPVKYCPSEDMKDLVHGLRALKVTYFRPYGWLPAQRIELPFAVASSPTRLSMVLEGIMRQFLSPAVCEPYPLFLADRMVKSLGSGVAVVEQAVAQYVAGDSPDIETTLLCLQNYRTEGGRGGV